MNIYKVFQLGMICLCFPATSFSIPTPLSRFLLNILIFSQSQFTKRIYSFSLLLSFDKFLWNGVSSLEWIFLRNSCRGVHSHSNGDKTSFSLESNIMMTLKLDMKHICKKDVRRGAIWAWVGSLGGRRGALHQCRGDGRELRAFLRRGSRCRDQTAPQ